MWKTPIYKLNRPLPFVSNTKRQYKQIWIDVTRSAPSFSTPGRTLERTLRTALNVAGITKVHTILDFGAGKLRNAVHLLSKGHKVCAVEFEQLFQKSEQAKSLLQKAQQNGSRFSKLVFPHEFQKSERRFDFAMLINVLNTMPVVAERLLVLRYCHQKLRPDSYLLWYTQRGDTDYYKY
jgi:2-polyprenyl-3-methyl-5-hydroxy-6-metoxy-1,4-benzoquinol methylase